MSLLRCWTMSYVGQFLCSVSVSFSMSPSVCRVSDLVSSLPPPVGTLPTPVIDQGYYLLTLFSKAPLLARYAKYDPAYCESAAGTRPVLAQSGPGWRRMAGTGAPHRRSLSGPGTCSLALLAWSWWSLPNGQRRSLPLPPWSDPASISGHWRGIAGVCTETMFHPGCDLQIASAVLAQTSIAGNTSHHWRRPGYSQN